MRKVISILSTVFFLAAACTITLANVVPGAVIYLDASNNPAHPDAWANLGTAGGELVAILTAMKLEQGTIEIPNLNIVMLNAKFYTATEPLQSFGGAPQTLPAVFLGEFTLEFLLRRNGDLFGQEHGVFAFRSWGMDQGIEGRIPAGTGDLQIEGPGARQSYGINLEPGVWTWIAITGDKQSFIVYQDGKEVGKDQGYVYDKNVIVDSISIGAGSYMGTNDNFNGSWAMVRVYDRALSADEIMENETVVYQYL